MQTVVEFFKGLASGSVKAPPDQAKSLQNVCTYRMGGRLELANGLKILASGDTGNGVALPTFPTPSRLSGSVTWRDLHTFRAAGASGDVTFYVLAGTFDRSKTHAGGGTVSTSGLFVTPYYDSAGTLVTNAWLELTEFYVCRFESAGASSVVLKTHASLPANDYFNEWILVHKGDFTDTTNNFVRVTDWDLATRTLTVDFLGTSLGWSATPGSEDEVYLFRNLQARVTPSTIASSFRGLYDEARWTSGNGTSDLDLAIAYKNKTMGWGQVVRGILSEPGVMEYMSKAWGFGGVGEPSGDSTTNLAEGRYTLKSSLKFDDGQETELRDLSLGATVTVGSSIYTDSGTFVVRDFVRTSDGVLWVLMRDSGGNNSYLYRIDSNGTYSANLLLYKATNIVLNAFDTTESAATVDVIGGYSSGGINYLFITSYWQAASYWQSGTQLRGTTTETLGATDAIVDNSSVCVGTSRSRNYNLEGEPFFPAFDPGPVTQWKIGWLVYGTAGSWHARCVTGNSFFLDYEISTEVAAPVVGCGGYFESGKTAPGGAVGYAGYWVSGTTKLHYLTGSGTVSTYTLPSRPYAAITVSGTYVFLGDTDGQVTRTNLATDSLLYTADQTGSNGIKSMTVGPDGGPVFTSYLTAYWLDPSGTLNASATIPAEYGVRVAADEDGFLTESISTSPTTIIPIELSASQSVRYLSGSEYIQLSPWIAPGSFPRRAKTMRIWMDKDGGGYFMVKEVDLLTGTWSSGEYNSALGQWYRVKNPVTITKADWDSATELATTSLGRSATDDGVIRYSSAATLGNRVVAAGVRLDGTLQRNKVFVSALGNAPHYDAFANDVANVLDVDYNDGDEVVSVVPMGDRILVLKKNSVVVCTQLGDGSWSRDLVSQRVGTVSQKSVQVFDDAVFWLDDRQVIEFSGRGINVISDGRIQDRLIAASTANKAAAIATIDRENYTYRLLVGTDTFVWDIRAREWFMDVIPSAYAPAAFSYSPATLNFVQLVTGTNVGVYAPAEGKLYGTATALDWHWESSDVLTNVGSLYDIVIRGFSVECESSAQFTIALRVNGSGSDFVSKTITAGTTTAVYLAPFNRCKRFSVRLAGSRSADDQVVKIKSFAVFYDILPTVKTV